MKHYLLSVQQPDGPPPPPEAMQRIMADVDVVIREMHERGAWVFNGGLHAAETATVVRFKPGDAEALMTDGPYTEGKEHVGGVCVLRAPDLDAALEWGRKLARATTLPIEVRPFHPIPEPSQGSGPPR